MSEERSHLDWCTAHNWRDEDVSESMIITPDEIEVALQQATAEDFFDGLADASVGLAFVDPPWQTPDRKSTITKPDGGKIRVDYSAFTGAFDWRNLVEQSFRVLEPDGYLLVWCGWNNISHVLDLGNEIFGNGRNQAIARLIPNPPGRARGKKDGRHTDPKTGRPVKIGGGLISAFDMIAVIRRPGPTPARCNYGIDARTNSEAYESFRNYRIAPNPRGMPHPASKPIGLARALIREHSNPGDVVLDVCCGGGSLLAAAAIEGRFPIGCDKGVDDEREKATGKPWIELARRLVLSHSASRELLKKG